jgi:hypothetical protein
MLPTTTQILTTCQVSLSLRKSEKDEESFVKTSFLRLFLTKVMNNTFQPTLIITASPKMLWQSLCPKNRHLRLVFFSLSSFSSLDVSDIHAFLFVVRKENPYKAPSIMSIMFDLTYAFFIAIVIDCCFFPTMQNNVV